MNALLVGLGSYGVLLETCLHNSVTGDCWRGNSYLIKPAVGVVLGTLKIKQGCGVDNKTRLLLRECGDAMSEATRRYRISYHAYPVSTHRS